MAYAAVVSLKLTIKHFLNSSHISLVSCTREILENAHEEVKSLQEALKRLDEVSSWRLRLSDLDGDLRDGVEKLECMVESHIAVSESEISNIQISLDLEEATQEINSSIHMLKKMMGVLLEKLKLPQESGADDVSSRSSTVDRRADLVGLSQEYCKQIKGELLGEIMRPVDFGVFAIVVRVGSGRTILARNLFEELCTGRETYIECSAWVSIGKEYGLKETLVSILVQICCNNPDQLQVIISEGDEKRMGEYLLGILLKSKRYMIVLDDVEDANILRYLMRSFPEKNNGSLILFTTSSVEEARLTIINLPKICEINNNEDENLVIQYFVMVFLIDALEYDEALRKIAKKCEGLPIVIAKAMTFFGRSGKMTPEKWKMLADDNTIFTITDELSETYKIIEDLKLLDSVVDEGIIGFVKFYIKMIRMTKELRLRFFPEKFFPHMRTISIYGMAGIGKTALIKKIFEDPSICRLFDHLVLITLGQKYQYEEILIDILAQIYPKVDKMQLKENVGLQNKLCSQLSYQRCVIVLDDMWNPEPLHYMKKYFASIKGIAFVTSRITEVAELDQSDGVFEMKLLNEEDSWCLFRHNVFPEGLCPDELKEVGMLISKNCEGLPLLILKVADLISKAEMTPEYWNKAAEKKSLMFMEAHTQLSTTLLPSYKNLPQHIKACFLYIGVFDQDYEIPTSRLIKLLIADGFLEPSPSQIVEDFIMKCLLELVKHNLLIVSEKSSDSRIKTCRLHCVFWHLCNSEAMKNMFFHALNTYDDKTIEGAKGQRRLCIRNNVLLGLKGVYNSITSISTLHSLLCTAPPHQYPVPINFGMRLLRVLDALTLRFYHFPIEVVKLIHLKYLALTYNGNLPTSISKLRNLHNLIVSRHLSIYSFGDVMYLPVEIWDMKELRHLQVMGSVLPEPYCHDSNLPNLVNLLDVSAHCCSKRILERIPNLKRLCIRFELEDCVDKFLQSRLNRISDFPTLEALKCVVAYPEIRSMVVTPPIGASMFSSTLKKLSLSGLGYSWDYMNIIAKLDNLQVLKIRCYAFRGAKWEMSYPFVSLKFLLIEDTDLVCWESKYTCYLSTLRYLSFNHCYNLKELPTLFYVDTIKIVDCPLALTWANQMKESLLKPVEVEASWNIK